MPVGIEQHLMGLQQIGAQQKGPAVRQLDMGDLKLGALATKNSIILAPVELERLTGAESQRNKRPAPRGLLLALLVVPPFAGKSGNPTVGAREAEYHKIGVKLLQGPALLARAAGLRLQPGHELVDKSIQLARALRHDKLRLDRPSV
jgi:hypothetical protein